MADIMNVKISWKYPQYTADIEFLDGSKDKIQHPYIGTLVDNVLDASRRIIDDGGQIVLTFVKS